jgi:hypothetical protein
MTQPSSSKVFRKHPHNLVPLLACCDAQCKLGHFACRECWVFCTGAGNASWNLGQLMGLLEAANMLPVVCPVLFCVSPCWSLPLFHFAFFTKYARQVLSEVLACLESLGDGSVNPGI